MIQQHITLQYGEEIVAICPSPLEQGVLYGISASHLFIKIHLQEQRITPLKHIVAEGIDMEEGLSLHISPDGRYLCIVNRYGRYGYVYDTVLEGVVLHLDRQDYYYKVSAFPLAFFCKEHTTYLIHASNWNRLDITNLTELRVITTRDKLEYGSEHYLDYFYGELHLSPNNEWLVSSGWVWQPFSVLKFTNVENWSHHNIYESEHHHSGDIAIWSYNWDRAMCWTNNHTLAYFYDPKEEGASKEECDEQQIVQDKSYILFYDILQSTVVQRIAYPFFPKNEYHEITNDCRLFCYNNNLLCCSNNGTSLVNLDTGETLYHNTQIQGNLFCPVSGTLYALHPHNVIETATIL